MNLKRIFKEGNEIYRCAVTGGELKILDTITSVSEEYLTLKGTNTIKWTLDELESVSSAVNGVIQNAKYVGRYEDIVKMLKELQDNSNICWEDGQKPLYEKRLQNLARIGGVCISIIGHGTYITFEYVPRNADTSDFINLSETRENILELFSPEHQKELTQLLESKYLLLSSYEDLGTFNAQDVGLHIARGIDFQFERNGLEIYARYNGELYGCAKCRITDTFDVDRGMQLAYLRAVTTYYNKEAKKLENML